MRTLKLTHEEISLILRGLGIAEMQCNQVRKNQLETLINVRGVDNLTEIRKEADGIFELENKFADLILDIKSGEKDV